MTNEEAKLECWACGETGAAIRPDAEVSNQLLCEPCADAYVLCDRCSEPIREARICSRCEDWDCEELADDDGSPRFSRFLAGMGGRVQP